MLYVNVNIEMSIKQVGSSQEETSYSDRLLMKAFKAARSIQDLREITEAEGSRDAYLTAKETWRELHRTVDESTGREIKEGIPGREIDLGRTTYKIHGITHAGTREERDFLRRHVKKYIEDGEKVYTEQGIRGMYFDDFDEVKEIDDYSWASEKIERQRAGELGFDAESEHVDSLKSRVMKKVFSAVSSGEKIYGGKIKHVLGNLASRFLMEPENLGTGENFLSFTLHKEASKNPGKLSVLQSHYEGTFLPQPVEREWLRNQSQELEIYTHSRNERIADYIINEAGDVWNKDQVIHVITGAAHQPGVLYYIDQYKHGFREPETIDVSR